MYLLKGFFLHEAFSVIWAMIWCFVALVHIQRCYSWLRVWKERLLPQSFPDRKVTRNCAPLLLLGASTFSDFFIFYFSLRTTHTECQADLQTPLVSQHFKASLYFLKLLTVFFFFKKNYDKVYVRLLYDRVLKKKKKTWNSKEFNSFETKQQM